jgi:hypothetical protein
VTKNPDRQTQKDLETVYSKYQLMPVLREEFGNFLKENDLDGDDVEMHKDMLAQICLHRQADPETMVGVLSPKHGSPQEVSDKLFMAAEFDLIDFDGKKFILRYDISNDMDEMLSKYQYPMPMIVKPKEVKSNLDTGYETITNSVVLNGSSIFKDKDMCLDHLNRANSVGLCLEYKTITEQEGRFKKPKRKPEEAFDAYRKRVRQAEVFFSASFQVMEELTALTDTVYLTHRYDRRGRCYASGYHVNSQGTDYNKAVLTLSNKELIK